MMPVATWLAALLSWVRLLVCWALATTVLPLPAAAVEDLVVLAGLALAAVACLADAGLAALRRRNPGPSPKQAPKAGERRRKVVSWRQSSSKNHAVTWLTGVTTSNQWPTEEGSAHASVVRTLQQLPVVAVTRPVMQHPIVADGAHWAAWAASRMRAAASTSANAGANAREDGADLRRMDAPHPGVTQFLGCALGRSLHRGRVGEFRHHAMRGAPCRRHDRLLQSPAARTTRGWANCPCDVMAWAGMAPPWEETKSINPKLMLCTWGWDAISKA